MDFRRFFFHVYCDHGVNFRLRHQCKPWGYGTWDPPSTMRGANPIPPSPNPNFWHVFGGNGAKIGLKSTKNRPKIDQNINFQLSMPNGTLNHAILCDEKKIGKNIFLVRFLRFLGPKNDPKLTKKIDFELCMPNDAPKRVI